ncbi:nuclease-related domain-containing protein [Lapillicoccus jejuensis]|uniref:Nuclease-like protein n=1 Tax=Lapillicoccus jejuensis TaxID=402171 RepID=A0A542DV51_9MICO|nr:nuclease-related domain-containing protein [Lapillicoccus jejuensis]TQJ06973.1 nuclease-like protein [Lapillicoccus jejuensis]
MLDRKAAYARRRADAFARGAVGERLVAETLAPLTVDGWTVLHDRCVPHLGNLDHLAVGPGGVVVLDAKHWSSAVTVTRGLRAGSRTTTAVPAMTALTDQVRRVLVAASLDLPVRGLLVLTHDRNVALPHAVVDGVHVVGLRGLPPLLASAVPVADRATVEDAVRRLSLAFPPQGTTTPAALAAEQVEGPARPGLYGRANATLFVEPWTRSGRQRLYVHDDQGTALGWKDTVSGQVAVTHAPADGVVRALLEHAELGRLHLDRASLPKIPLALPGGRAMGVLGRLWTTFHVGYHWRRGGADRLYGELWGHHVGHHRLGYVDLATGAIHPVSEGPIAKDRSPAGRYLELMAASYARGRRAG